MTDFSISEDLLRAENASAKNGARRGLRRIGARAGAAGASTLKR